MQNKVMIQVPLLDIKNARDHKETIFPKNIYKLSNPHYLKVFLTLFSALLTNQDFIELLVFYIRNKINILFTCFSKQQMLGPLPCPTTADIGHVSSPHFP